MTVNLAIKKKQELKKVLLQSALYTLLLLVIFLFVVFHSSTGRNWGSFLYELKMHWQNSTFWYFVPFLAAIPITIITGWLGKWKVIEDPLRAKYAQLYQSKKVIYSAPPKSEQERELRRQTLNKELATLNLREERFKLNWVTGNDAYAAAMTEEERASILAEFTDAKALITRELAAIERLSLPVEEPHVIVAPAPVATQQVTEETGLERY